MNMKNILVFIFIILVSVGFVVGQDETCKDSDGGLNYYVKGSVYTCYSGEDTTACTTPTYDSCTYCTGACPPGEKCEVQCGAVVEYYCDNNEIKKETKVCPNGCEYGACIKEKEPYCSAIGTRSEGWYQYGDLIKYANCNGCVAECKAIETLSEGWYSSCDNSLIKWERCSETECEQVGNSCCINNECGTMACKIGEELIFEGCDENCQPIGKCVPETSTCTDSDGGKNYYVKGTTCIGGGSTEIHCEVDKCVHPDCVGCKDQILEYYCKGNEIQSEIVDCPNGCEDGACIKEDSDEFSLKVKTDKTQYKVGETVKITASVSGDSSLGIEKAEVSASLSGPGPEIAYYIDLKKDSCAVAVPRCLPGSECPQTTICYFKGTYYPKHKGDYKITATAKLDNMVKTDYAKFNVVSSPPQGIYVKLGEKFSLAEKQAAKVTDYDYMKIILNKIIPIRCIKAPCPQMVEVQVEMPCNIAPDCDEETGVCEVCASEGTQFRLSEGESKEVFGAKLTFLKIAMNIKTGKEYATFIVDKAISHDLVDIEIHPVEQTISYGEKAVYNLKVIDKHPLVVCTLDCPAPGPCPPCEQLTYTYSISVKNLPFSKKYPKDVTLMAGQSKTFELIVRPYNVVVEKEPDVESGEEPVMVITGKAVESTSESIVAKPVKKIKVAVSEKETAVESIAVSEVVEEIAEEPATPEESEEEPTVMVTPLTHLIKRYKFSVTTKLKDNYEVQDTAHAVLAIKPKSLPPTPPPFPGEKVSIKLYRGWNLISLPGKLIRFDKTGLVKNQKLIGFVYIKEKQEYVSLNEAEKILGNKLREYLAKNAFWVYSRTPSTLNVWVDRKISYQDLELVKGWNLVPITEDMLGGYLTDILADCDLEKMHLWDANNQKWEKISLEYSFSANQFGYGFLVKTIDYCKLVGPDIIAPPAMPE